MNKIMYGIMLLGLVCQKETAETHNNVETSENGQWENHEQKQQRLQSRHELVISFEVPKERAMMRRILTKTSRRQSHSNRRTLT